MTIPPDQFRIDAAGSLGRIEAMVESNQIAIVRVEGKVDRHIDDTDAAVVDLNTRVSKIEGAAKMFRNVSMGLVAVAAVVGAFVANIVRWIR